MSKQQDDSGHGHPVLLAAGITVGALGATVAVVKNWPQIAQLLAKLNLQGIAKSAPAQVRSAAGRARTAAGPAAHRVSGRLPGRHDRAPANA